MNRRTAGGAGWPVRSTHPVIVLLAAILTAGCAGDTPGAPPSTRPPADAATTTPYPAGGSPTTSVTPTDPIPTTPAALRYVFPVRGTDVAYHPTHSVYPGTDIFADCGTPVLAVTDGRILEVSRVDRYRGSGPQGPYNGGLSVSLLGDDGVRYYGSHLTEVATGIDAGTRVHAGQQVGRVGRTGNANNVCHLHFGISPPCRNTGDWWLRRGVVWPAPFLDAWRGKKNKSPAGTVRAWHAERSCPPAP